LDSDPDAAELNLHDHDINELTEDMVEQIAEFTQLERLVLSDNLFT
jgi:hypothetical protein